MENNLVEFNRINNNIAITKPKEKNELALEDIFKDYDGEYKAEEFDWGFLFGGEVW